MKHILLGWAFLSTLAMPSGRADALAHLLGRQALLQPASNGPHFDAKRLGELGSRYHAAVNFDQPMSASISGLLQNRGPAAVIGGIGAVGINPVEAATDGAWSHVGQERFKTINPSLTYGDAAAAVTGVGLMIGVQTPILHASPRVVLWGPAQPVRPGQPASDYFTPKASATPRIAASQLGTGSISDGAAITQTPPPLLTVLVFNRYQSSEALTGDVFQWAPHPVKFTSQQPRDPDDVHGPPGYCARRAGVAANGQPIHPCMCHRMGKTDGEECSETEPPSLDPQCAKHCSEKRCQCPLACSTSDAPTKGKK